MSKTKKSALFWELLCGHRGLPGSEPALCERPIAGRLAGISPACLRHLERTGRITPHLYTVGGLPLYDTGQLPAIQEAAKEYTARQVRDRAIMFGAMADYVRRRHRESFPRFYCQNRHQGLLGGSGTR